MAETLRHWARLCVLAVAALAIGIPTAVADDIDTYDEGLLWRVTAPGRHDNYVFGTFHSADPRILAVIETVQTALFTCEVAAFELEMNKFTEARAFMEMVDRVLSERPRMTTLEDDIGSERFAALRRALSANLIPTETLQGMSPWQAYLTVSGSHTKPDTIDDDAPVLDVALQILAREAGLRVLPLETVEEQAGLFASTDPEVERLLLIDFIDNSEADGGLRPVLDARYEEIVAYYVSGNITPIMADQYPTGDRKQRRYMHNLMKRMLARRNARMVERAAPLLDAGPTFIAIGAAHLPGRTGMLNFFAGRGFTVSRVDIKIPPPPPPEEAAED
jgi:uncharacterized protein